jgi:hypothetical protein
MERNKMKKQIICPNCDTKINFETQEESTPGREEIEALREEVRSLKRGIKITVPLTNYKMAVEMELEFSGEEEPDWYIGDVRYTKKLSRLEEAFIEDLDYDILYDRMNLDRHLKRHLDFKAFCTRIKKLFDNSHKLEKKYPNFDFLTHVFNKP